MLIQKDVKQTYVHKGEKRCLRALLIQKDVKPERGKRWMILSLRALLIQKDVKLCIESRSVL